MAISLDAFKIWAASAEQHSTPANFERYQL
jgi:hypothetical protein